MFSLTLSDKIDQYVLCDKVNFLSMDHDQVQKGWLQIPFQDMLQINIQLDIIPKPE
jgi:hypothetical protein